MKKAIVVRWGAYGDLIMASACFPSIKKEGYHLTVSIRDYNYDMVKANPYVDAIDVYSGKTGADGEKRWEEMKKEYDLFINLSGSIEDKLLCSEGKPEFKWSYDKRQRECNINYYDHTMSVAGYPEQKGVNPELHLPRKAIRDAEKMRKRLKGKHVVLWVLSGSSWHKTYPFAEYVANAFTKRHKDVVILTVGGGLCEALEWQNSSTINYSGIWSMSASMAMTMYADMVVGTETGLMVAAGCHDVPKVIMLSHASEENLTKYWENVFPVHANVACYPCHQLHYTMESCPLDAALKFPVCMSKLKASIVLEAMEKAYTIKKAKAA